MPTSSSEVLDVRRSSLRTPIALLLVALVGIVLGPTVSRPDAHAAPAIEYVNLGDSYAAGTGTLPWAPGKSAQCWQSPRNFAHLLAARAGYRLNDASCGAASTLHLFTSQHLGVPPQLDALSPRTKLVTVMIGGNDSNAFVSTFFGCSAAGASVALHGAPCRDRYGNSLIRTIQTSTYANLVRGLRAVRVRAPAARIAVVGYPWITPARPQPCAGLPITATDIAYTHRVEAALNDAVRRAAKTTGATFVDTATPSIGHDACTPASVRWVEPLLPATEPYPLHPTVLGHLMISRIVQHTLGI